MARQPAAQVVPAHNTMLASAFRPTTKDDKQTVHGQTKTWQTEAWRMYFLVPELRYAANWMANVSSRAVLSSIKRKSGDAGTSGTGSPAARAALAEFFGGPEGQARWLHGNGLHLTIAGEVYTVGRKVKSEYVWDVVGTSEIQSSNGRWQIRRADGSGMWDDIDVPGNDILWRTWRPSPEDRLQADSAVRSLLGTLNEIVLLDQHIRAQGVSRLTGSGMLMIPDDLRIPLPDPETLKRMGFPPDATGADLFQQRLGEHLTEEIAEPGSASATVPFVVSMPAESIDKIKLMRFWSELDEKALEMREAAVRRLAMGLDMPAEQLTGTTSEAGGRWGLWQVDDSSIKAHIEPLLNLSVGSLTTSYIRVISEDEDDDIKIDTSALRLRPDHSKEAMELGEAGMINDAARRRENGFSEEDAMSPDQRKKWYLAKIATGSPSPEQVAWAAKEVFGVDMPVAIEQAPNELRPSPSLLEHPTQDFPDARDVAREAALVAASSAIVWRALERAGNRLPNMMPALQASATPPAERYLLAMEPTEGRLEKLLEGAWSCVVPILASAAADTGPVDTDAVARGLDAYTRNLITDRAQHDPQMMRAYLRREGI